MRVVLLWALLLGGCAKTGKQADETVVALDQVPAAVMAAAKKELPGVKFNTAWKTESGAFEIRGKTPEGKIRDVQVTATGDVLEVD